MKIVSRPTTIASTPSPSAKPARMMARPRIWPAASGLRPMAPAARPPRMPMPMPGPITPIAASPAPKCSIGAVPPTFGPWLDEPDWALVEGERSVRARCVWLTTLQRVHGLLGDLPLLRMVRLDGGEDEDQRQHAEDEGLDEVEHPLEQQQRDRQERHGQCRDHADRHLARVDVAEESHRQRDRLHQLEHQLDQADEHRDEAGADAVLELVERKVLAEVAADPETSEPLGLEVDKAHQRQ